MKGPEDKQEALKAWIHERCKERHVKSVDEILRFIIDFRNKVSLEVHPVVADNVTINATLDAFANVVARFTSSCMGIPNDDNLLKKIQVLARNELCKAVKKIVEESSDGKASVDLTDGFGIRMDPRRN